MLSDTKKTVASGYDQIAETYLQWTAGSSLRRSWLEAMLPVLPRGARVLDLGCGAGVPVARWLTEQGCVVVGVDGSPRQIALARDNEPRAEFIAADMTAVEFEPMSFDAVTAFYSITHVPRDEHPMLLRRIRTWLKPGGMFLASLGYGDTPAWMGEWLGTTMFFSHFDAATNLALVKDAGFDIDRSEIIGEEENGTEVRFLWVMARPSRPLHSN
jgi:ubiquinone/menaquinone biosynthesis C-methylase UbiE